MSNIFEEMKNELLEKSERERLDELTSKYSGVGEPDYSNMSLREELQTRMDLQNLAELKKKYGIYQMPALQSSSEDISRNYGVDTINDSRIFRKTVMSDEVPQHIVDFVRSNEGNADQMYLDTQGNKTVGYGTNVNDFNTFDKVNWQKCDRPASAAEKLAAFNEMEGFNQQGLYGQNYTARYYNNSAKHAIYITPEEKERLLREHLQKDLTRLRQIWPDFDNFQEGLQRGLADIRYNTGNVSYDNWSHLHNAIRRNDIFGEDGVLKNIHRKGVSEDRNRKVYNAILENAKNGIYK